MPVLSKVARGPAALSPTSMSDRWCFTVNNPGDWAPHVAAPAVAAAAAAAPEADDDIAYMVWQTERGEQGTVHIQGYVRFHRRKRMATVKNFFGRADMHLERARGNEKQCKEYCTKEDTRIDGSYGELFPDAYDPDLGQQGARTDLTAVAELCKQGATLTVIAQTNPETFIKFHAGISALHAAVRPPQPLERELVVFVLWGDTATGKTHRVMHAESPDQLYVCPGPGRDPWGAYRQEPAILLDEFDWQAWPLQKMNQILDKWPLQLDARYHNLYAAWTRVYICCNDSPTSWYSNATQALRAAIRRRIATRCRLVLDKERFPTIQSVFEEQAPEPNFVDENGLL